MPEDTAVLEPETATEEEQALPETEETAASTDAETDGSDDQPETESEQAEETLTKAEADRLVAEARAETEKNLREQAEADASKAQAQQRLSRIQQDRQGKLVNDLNSLASWISKEVDEGRDVKGRIDQNYIAQLAQRIDGMAFQEQHELSVSIEQQLIQREIGQFDVPRDLERQLAAAITAAVAGEPHGAVRMKEAQFRILVAAAKEKARAEWEAEQAEESGVSKLKQTEAARKAQKGPTQAATGSAGRSLSTIQDFEKKLAGDGLSDDEWSRYEKARSAAGLH